MTEADILNEKSLEIILNFKPSDKYDKNAINEILKLKNDIKKIIALLPKQEQEILDLRYFQNLSLEKIAERISKSRDEINRLMNNGVQNVKERLRKDSLSLENVQKVIEFPKIKNEIKEQNQQIPVKKVTVQSPKEFKRKSSFSGMVFSLVFYIIFFTSIYFVMQKFFFHNLPTISQLISGSRDVVQETTISNKIIKNLKPTNPYNIKIAGSSSLFGLARRWENSFNIEYPKYHINLLASDSNKGITFLIEGKADIANSSRPITSFDRKKAAEYGFELSEERVALDALIIIVNSKNPIDEISLDNLERIFNKEKKNWKEIVSFDNPLLPIVREKGSGTNDFVINRILEGDDFPTSINRKTSNADLIKFISENEGAIGFINSIGYPWENKNIKYLKVKNYDNSFAVSPFEGHKLNENAMRYGDYPLAHYLYLITVVDAPNKVQDFVSWILNKEGQRIVAYTGLIPVLESSKNNEL